MTPERLVPWYAQPDIQIGSRVHATVDAHYGTMGGTLVWAEHDTCDVPGWVWEDRPDLCVAWRDMSNVKEAPMTTTDRLNAAAKKLHRIAVNYAHEDCPGCYEQGRMALERLREADGVGIRAVRTQERPEFDHPESHRLVEEPCRAYAMYAHEIHEGDQA